MGNINIRINDEVFKLIKENLPLCTNIVKPTQKDIINAWAGMELELRDLRIGITESKRRPGRFIGQYIDQEHPEILEKRKAEADRRFEQMMSSFSRYIDPFMSFPYSFERYFK